jgi:hypothetical protein
VFFAASLVIEAFLHPARSLHTWVTRGGHRMCRIEQAFSQYSAVGRPPPWVPGFATWHGKLPCRSNSALFRSMNSRITRGPA